MQSLKISWSSSQRRHDSLFESYLLRNVLTHKQMTNTTSSLMSLGFHSYLTSSLSFSFTVSTISLASSVNFRGQTLFWVYTLEWSGLSGHASTVNSIHHIQQQRYPCFVCIRIWIWAFVALVKSQFDSSLINALLKASVSDWFTSSISNVNWNLDPPCFVPLKCHAD